MDDTSKAATDTAADRALDSLAVTPPDPEGGRGDGRDPRQNAGQDKAINKRLKRNPESKEAQLDSALDESMDASDPPSNTQPVHHQPAPSSGYDAEAERKRRAAKD